MDALAGYGSDSEPDECADSSGGEALSGLLAHYSDDDDNKAITSLNALDGKKPETPTGTNGQCRGNAACSGGRTKRRRRWDDAKDDHESRDSEANKHPNASNGNKYELPMSTNGQCGDNKACLGGLPKRRRRWDNANEDPAISIDIDSVLPPPLLSGNNLSRSKMLFRDYTTRLRRTLSLQLHNQSQGKELTNENQQLIARLEQLRDKFQPQHQDAADDASPSPVSSFASHLKSQREFGNPHLLKRVIAHYSLSPLQSHVGNSFGGFEDVERLVEAEEKARIAASKHCTRVGGGVGPRSEG